MVSSILALASQHIEWLSSRQALVARNVANANTPGYLAQDIQSFSTVVDQTGFEMATTNPAHLALDPGGPQTSHSVSGASWEITHSGNSVALEQEMIKAGEIHRGYSLDTAISRSFHQMLNLAAKG